MKSQVLRVAWYRLRTTFAGRWGSYLSVILLAGLVGGVAMGAIAAARRTQSSFPAYLASTNPSDFGAATAVLNPLIGSKVGYNPSLLRTIAHLPHLKKVESAVGLDVLALGSNGAPFNLAGAPPQAGIGLGSVNDYGFDLDRPTVVQGRMADPRRADEMVMQTEVAQAAHLRVGARVLFGIYTNAQTQLPGFGTTSVPPYRKIEVTLTGTIVEARSLVEDDVDNSTSLAYFTPAFTRQFLACCTNYTQTGIQVAGGRRYLNDVNAELQQVLPKAFPAPLVGSTVIDKAERAIKPESIALGVFGGIAALAALLIAAQVIGRQTRLGVDDVRTLRALGASPAMTSADGFIGIVGSVVIGSLLAVVVAVALSPLAPIGPVRPVDPTPGASFDWTVLGFGFLVLVVGLGVVGALFAYRAAPRRGAEQRQEAESRRSSVVSRAASLGLPTPAVTGIRFALEPGVGRNAVPVRSAILGAALAVIVVVTTVTFSASLNTLVSHPRLYGWNWDSILVAGGGVGNIPQHQATDLLDHDPYVQAWSGAYSGDLHIDGQTIPVLGERPNAAVQPPVLSGHALDAPGQVVLGAITLAQLHKHVGDTVVESSGSGLAKHLQIVGTATMPTIGGPGPHLEMGTGALLPYSLIPVAARNPFNDPTTGPEEIFVNFRPGVNHAAALGSLQRIATQLTNNFNFGVFVGSVLRPAEIVNYRSMGTTPAVLGAALTAGAVVALGLTLVASVRRRRRDLALLKTLGFTRSQLASVVAWQSSISVAIGTLVGVPLGIVLGRSLWTVFAHQINAVPAPSVPALTIVLIVVGALVLANLVAALPGRFAARTPTALLLRAE
jgi:hypothetical protein